jgi:hypothetical protein
MRTVKKQFPRLGKRARMGFLSRILMSSRQLHPAAFCPVHGLFPVVGMILTPGSINTFVHCATNCSVRGCIATCEIIPGEYRPRDKGRLDLLLDASISAEALAAIREVAAKLRDGAISSAEAQKEIQRIAPQLSGLLKGWTHAEAIAFAGVIVAAIALLKPSPPPTITVQPVIEKIVERPPDNLLSSSALTRVPLPRPRPKGLK